ncbi:homeobox protein dve-1-like isoform X2 [Artemia franciscana]
MTKKSQTPTMDMKDGENRINCGKLIPVHCVVEIETRINSSCDVAPTLEADSYVMVPATTSFSDIIPVAMGKLGYEDDIGEATAKLVVKNWKPLHLDQIAFPTDNVGRILGEMTNIATLKISIKRNCEKVARELKEKLLKILLPQSKKMLSSLGCPLDEEYLQKLGSDKSCEVPTEEMFRRFEDWFRNQNNNSQPASTRVPELERTSISSLTNPLLSSDTSQIMSSSFGTGRTRVRTTFDPDFELPRLQKWFLENPHPTRSQILDYVQELNSLESRRGRKPLDMPNIVYWFKNARAAQKRSESRENEESKSLNDLTDNDDEEPLNDSTTDDDLRKEIVVTIKDECDENDRVSRASNESEIESEYDEFDNHNEKKTTASVGESPENLSCKEERSYQSESGSSWSPQKYSQDQHSQIIERYSNFQVPIGPPPLIGTGGLMYMPPYINSFSQMGQNASGLSCLSEERRKRNRTFIDPVSEVPLLEHWFSINTHPAHSMVVRFTDELNRQQYRQKFPKLEPKNVQFWFKNRRAKCKRLKTATEIEF